MVEVILGLGNGRGLESGLSCSSVMESPDPEWHVAGLSCVAHMETSDDQ